MSRRDLIVALVIGMLAFGGWAWAQQRITGPPAPQPESGLYTIAPVGQSAILLDTKSGKTWEMTRSAETGQMVWLPGKRIDTKEEVEVWRDREEMIKRKREMEQRIREEERRMQEQKNDIKKPPETRNESKKPQEQRNESKKPEVAPIPKAAIEKENESDKK